MPNTFLNGYQRMAHLTRHQVKRDGWRTQTLCKKPGIKLGPMPQHFYNWVLSSHTHKKKCLPTLKGFPAQQTTTLNKRKNPPRQMITALGISSETWKTKLYLMPFPAKEMLTSSWTENCQISSKILFCPWQKRHYFFKMERIFLTILTLFTLCTIASQE